jgi:hypothetical protein
MEMIIPFAIFAILIALFSHAFDNDRVASYIENEMGGKLISKTWEPFGKGWIGEKNDRIYKVLYLDRDGNTHEAFVKTSSFSGVYFSDDKIIQYNSNLIRNSPESEEIVDSVVQELSIENERLRQEVERLRAEKDKRI